MTARSRTYALVVVASIGWTRNAAADCRPIDSLPVTIDRPGTYCLTGELSFTGGGAAIAVRADGVQIDLGGHTITTSGRPGRKIGIASGGSSNVIIRNGGIHGFATGVSLTGGRENVVSGIKMGETRHGVLMTGDNNTVEDCSIALAREGVAVHVAGAQARILNNQVSGDVGRPGALVIGPSRGGFVERNRIRDDVTGDGSTGISITESESVVVVGNTFEGVDVEVRHTGADATASAAAGKGTDR